jgi:HEAT repeat protein
VALYLQNYVKEIDGIDSQVELVLLQLIEDGNPILTQIAFDAIEELRSPGTVAALVTMLQQRPDEFGETIAGILARFPKRRVYNAISPYLDEADESTLPYFIKILGHSGVHPDGLKKYLKHPSPQIQEAGIQAIGFTEEPEGIPLLLPFIMSRQNSLARCAAAQSLDLLIGSLGKELSSPRNIFDGLFVMLNTYRNEEELSLVAQAFGTLFSVSYPELSDVNLAVVRGRLLDLIPGVSNEVKVIILRALQPMVDLSSFEIIREMRAIVSLQIQEMVASLYSRLPSDLRVIADVADMISHAEYSFRKFWILAAGRLKAVSLTDMLVPLLAEHDFRADTFQAFVIMGQEVLPYLAKYLDHEDPRIQKMSALVFSRIAQDHLDRFCQISTSTTSH